MLDGMTNIKAREVLKELKDYSYDLPHYSPDEVAESLEMAMNVLNQAEMFNKVKTLCDENHLRTLTREEFEERFEDTSINVIKDDMWGMFLFLHDVENILLERDD